MSMLDPHEQLRTTEVNEIVEKGVQAIDEFMGNPSDVWCVLQLTPTSHMQTNESIGTPEVQEVIDAQTVEEEIADPAIDKFQAVLGVRDPIVVTYPERSTHASTLYWTFNRGGQTLFFVYEVGLKGHPTKKYIDRTAYVTRKKPYDYQEALAHLGN